MDQFVLQTIESLMSIERNEFLDSCTEDKGNGSYTRAFQSLSKNGLVIKVPRTRSGDFSPDTLELLKINQQQIDDICLSLYKKASAAPISPTSSTNVLAKKPVTQKSPNSPKSSINSEPHGKTRP
jgi:hypothetical protein